MSSDIEPIHLDSLLEVIEELFGADYESHRLGTPGWWGGSDLQRLGLERPVERPDFENLFTFHDPQGRIPTPEGRMDNNPVVAQRVTFEARPEVTTLWALGDPQQQQELASSHVTAVRQTMSNLHSLALLESESPHPVHGRGCLFASFTEGAAENLTPRLRTSVLICQQYRLPDGQAVHFPLNLAPGTSKAIFERWEWRRLSDRIGVLGATPETQVPENLFKPLAAAQGRSLRAFPEAPAELSNSEIFSRWKAQASQTGFGAAEVQNAFSAAYRHGLAIHAREQVLRSAAIEERWNAMIRTGAREQRQDRHGPEHGPER